MKVAIVQYAPEHLDLARSLSKALDLIGEAASKGATLIVFGETWFSGYPSWLDHCTNIAFWNDAALKEVFVTMVQNSMDAGGDEMQQLCQSAAEHKVSLVFGANEVSQKAKGTIFNSLFFIDEKGKLVNHHRKLVPTFTEKLLYGNGDGAGLVAAELNGSKVTGSICWEHWMPLTRQALHSQGEQIHIAVWPEVHEMHQIASRQYAFEGRCYVLAAGQLYHSSKFPHGLDKKESLKKEDINVLRGGSCIIGPDGQFVIEPVFDKEEIIYAELDLKKTLGESINLDVSGHYQRHDIFTLEVDKHRQL